MLDSSDNDLSISRSFKYVDHTRTYKPEWVVCRQMAIIGFSEIAYNLG